MSLIFLKSVYRDDVKAKIKELYDNQKRLAAVIAEEEIDKNPDGEKFEKFSSANISRFVNGKSQGKDVFEAILKRLYGDAARWQDYGEEARDVPNCQHNLRPRFADLLDRQVLLDAIDTSFETRSGTPVVALIGMPGVGKSDLALQYAWKNLEKYPGGICWVDGRGNDLAERIVNFAKIFHLQEPPQNVPPLAQLAWCWQYWVFNKEPVLIVIDDVDNINIVRDLLPVGQPRFHFVLTCRQQLESAISQVAVPLPSDEQAIQMLIGLLPNDPRPSEEAETVRELCACLGNLPLALDLIGKYLQMEPVSIAEVLEDLQSLQDHASSYPLLNDADMAFVARRGAEAAFNLSWDVLSPDARSLAVMLSFFAPAPIPWDVLEAAAHPILVKGQLRPSRFALTRSHLLQHLEGSLYQLHRLIRSFFRQKAAQIDPGKLYPRYLAQALAVQARLLPEKPKLEHLKAFRLIVCHVEEVIDAFLPLIEPNDAQTLFSCLPAYYRGEGLFTKGMHWAEQAVAYAEKNFGAEHPHTACSAYDLALMAYFQQNVDAASTSAQRAAAIVEASGSGESLLKVRVLVLQASLLRQQRLFKEALQYAGIALGIAENLWGNAHIETAEARMTLAVILLEQGKTNLDDITPMVEQVLTVRRAHLAPHDPDIAQAMNMCAKIYVDQKEFAAAISYYEEAMTINQTTLGNQHSQTAISYNNLAKALVANGEYDRAEALYKQAIDVLQARQMLGSAAWVMHNLALLFVAQHKIARARDYCEQALLLLQQQPNSNQHYLIQVENTLKSIK